MSQRRSTSRHDRDDDDGYEKPAKSKRRRSSSRLWWIFSRLMVVAILLAVVVYFVPPLIARRSVWKKLVASASPDVAKLIDAKSIKLGWFSSIQVNGLVVKDAGGHPFAEVEQITSRQSLLGLALGYPHLGTFDIIHPNIKIVLRADGSNVEDFLAKLPRSEAKSSSASPGVGVVVTNGEVVFDDQITNRQWKIEKLAVDVASPAAAGQPKTGKVTAELKSLLEGSEVSPLAVEFSVQPGQTEKAPAGNGEAQIALQGLPTEIAEGAMRRFGVDVRPRGPLTMKVAGKWQENGSVRLLLSELATPGISVAAPKYLGTDTPKIVINSTQAAIEMAGGKLTVPNLNVSSNLIAIGGRGTAVISGSQPITGEASNASAEVQDGELEIKGQVNLAELVRQLPATLHMRPDAQLASGVAEFSLASQPGAGGRNWVGNLKTRDLRGVAGGRPIQFDQPLEVSFKAQQTPSGPVLEQLVGQASFLRIEGRGALRDGSIKAEADLNKLVEELDRLVDWSSAQLEGKLVADLRWKQDVAAGWSATADTVARDFRAIFPGHQPWQEQNLRLVANVNGDLTGASLSQINHGTLSIEAGSDKLSAELTEAVKAPSAASVWPMKFDLHGNLEAWAARLQPFVPMAGLRVAGAIDATGAASVSPQESQLGQTNIRISQFVVNRLDATGAGISINEPRIEMETSGSWNQTKSTLALGRTTFASSALAFGADGVRLTLGKEPTLVGTVDLRGDIAKLSSWFPSAQRQQSAVEGGLEGHVELGYQGQAIAAIWNANINDLRYLVPSVPTETVQRTSLISSRPAWKVAWQEPRVNFAGQGKFEPAGGLLKIDRTSLTTANAAFAAAGTVGKLTAGTPEVDLSGEITYDLEQITQQIQARAAQPGPPGSPSAGQPTALPYGLDTLQLTGKEKRQFVLKGPLLAATGNLSAAQPVSRTGGIAAVRAPATGATPQLAISDALAGEASLGWQGAQYVGLVAGPADFRAKLAGGVAQIGPLDIPLSEGRLTAAPRVMLTNAQQAVVFDRGPVLENVRISPEMCTLWLKFVAPMVADATRAEGKFSLSLEGANVPIAAPLSSSVAGTLAIQSAQIGPGPMPQQFLGVIKQVKSFIDGAGGASGTATTESQSQGWLLLPAQDVFFEVQDGVVRNRGLKMSLGDVVITTQGTVAIESQQVNLVTTIPIPDNWIKNPDGVLSSLRGQVLTIPVTGTLKQPRLDTRGLTDLGKQLAGSAVRGAISRQLERGLQGAQGEGGLLQQGGGLLQGDIGQGINRLFGPRTPATPTPQAAPPPR
jgi:translocation and assembly module TamB